jgi:hypothetical protein
MDQIERVCSEIGFAAASVPSYARAAYAMPVIDTQANMTKVTADLIKRTYDCGLMPIAGMRDGASKWGVLVAGPQGSQSRMINLTSGIEKPAEEIANAQAEIQTLNASKTGTSKAVPILLAITIGMTVV